MVVYGPDAGHTAGVGGVGSPSVGSSPFAGAGNGSRFFAGGTAHYKILDLVGVEWKEHQAVLTLNLMLVMVVLVLL